MVSTARSILVPLASLAIVAAVAGAAEEPRSPAYGYKIAHATCLAGGSDAFVVKLMPGK